MKLNSQELAQVSKLESRIQVSENELLPGLYPSESVRLDRKRPYRLLTNAKLGQVLTYLDYLYEDTQEVVRLKNKPENQTYQMQIESALFWAKWFEKSLDHISKDHRLCAPVMEQKLARARKRQADYLEQARLLKSAQQAAGRA